MKWDGYGREPDYKGQWKWPITIWSFVIGMWIASFIF
jgi:hypothetical protein